MIDGDGQPGPALNDGHWHHVAFTFDRDGSVVRYVDGLALAGTDDISSIGNIDNDNIFAIGTRGNFTAERTEDSTFDGRIDDVRLYDHLLTSDEVHGLAIPEPTTLALLGLGMVSLLGRRRRRG